MKRREFLTGGAAAAWLVSCRKGWAQSRGDEAKLRRVAIMSLCFNGILKNPSQPDNAARTLDVMDLGQMFVDRYGVHNVEMQHSHFPSTEPAYLKAFRDRLAKTKSQVTNINLEFGPQNISAADPALRQQAVDRTREWIDHAVALGSPRIMVNQGAPTQDNKDAAIATRIGDHLAVQHPNLARQLIGEARIVRDHDDGGAIGVELADELHDRCAGGAVKVPGRFVGEHDRRMPDEGPGDRNPLPLPAGELGGLEARAFGEADPFERLIRAPVPLGGGDAGVQQPVGDVLPHRGMFGQEELLEDEPDLPSPQQRQLAVTQPRRVDPTNPHHTTAGPFQRPHDVQERGLARPGGPDDRHQLAPPDGKGHPPEGGHRRLLTVDLGHAIQLQKCFTTHNDGTTT